MWYLGGPNEKDNLLFFFLLARIRYFWLFLNLTISLRIFRICKGLYIKIINLSLFKFYLPFRLKIVPLVEFQDSVHKVVTTANPNIFVWVPVIVFLPRIRHLFRQFVWSFPLYRILLSTTRVTLHSALSI